MVRMNVGDVVFLVVEIFFVMCAVVMVVDYFRRLRLARAPSTRIAAAADGAVKIEGAVRVIGEPLHDPLWGRECVLWEIEIIGGHGEEKKVIAQQTDMQDFLVEDGTGRALVRCRENAHQLDVAIAHDRSPVPNPTPARVRVLLGADPPVDLTCREGMIEVGHRIVVYGRCRREPDPDAEATGGTYRERPTRLVIEPLDGRLQLSDGFAH